MIQANNQCPGRPNQGEGGDWTSDRNAFSGSDSFSEEDTDFTKSGTASETESLMDLAAPAKGHWTHPPLVRKYYNSSLKAWLPIALPPEIAASEILGSSSEDGDATEESSGIETGPEDSENQLQPDGDWHAPGYQEAPPLASGDNEGAQQGSGSLKTGGT